MAYPERSLLYAPLLLALGGTPPWPGSERTVPLLLPDGARVAEAVADGTAVAGALPLPDLVAAVAAGAPLAAFGALTRRAAGQLVVGTAPVPGPGPAGLPRSVEALRGGEWRGRPVGVTTGSGGSEALLRLWWLSGGSGSTAPAEGTGVYLERDPWWGEPRWIGFGTAEALVAALKDGRVVAFLGPSTAAAQALLLGVGEVLANVSDGSFAGEAGAALPVVLVARRDRATPTDPLLVALTSACARAGVALDGEGGGALAARALPEADALTLQRAVRLDAPHLGEPYLGAPQGIGSGRLHGGDGRVEPEAVARYLALAALTGAAPAVDGAALTAG